MFLEPGGKGGSSGKKSINMQVDPCLGRTSKVSLTWWLKFAFSCYKHN